MTMTAIEPPGSRAERRRDRARRRKMIALVLIAVIGAAAGTTFFVANRSNRDGGGPAIVGAASEGSQIVTLLAMSLHDGATERADSLTVFAIDRDGTNPVVLFVPTKTLSQIPSFAYAPVGDALTRSAFLQRIALENVMGIEVDRTIAFDDVAMGQALDSLGGISVDVQQDVYEADEKGTRSLVFQPGPQRMDAATAVTYMTEFGDGQTEIDRFPRTQQVWEAVFQAGPKRVREAIAAINKEALEQDDAKALAEMLSAMAAAPDSARVYESLPVEPVLTGGEDEAYKLKDADLDRLIRRAFRASQFTPDIAPSARVPLEILNGVGRPGAGERASALLIEAGYRVVLTDNARRFGENDTRIVIYSTEPAARRLADRLKQILGFGTIQVGTRGQTVVQATIIVGKDLAGP